MLDVKLFEQQQERDTYEPTPEEKTKLEFLQTRIAKMQQNRVVVDREWNTYQTMIDAIFVPYPDERSSSVVPLASSIIELFVAEATKIKTEFLFKAEISKYGANAKAFEYAWKYDRRKNNRKKVFTRSEYIAAGFGTDVIFVNYESYTKIQKEPVEGSDQNAPLEWIDKVIDKEGIVVANVDVRQFYLDNEAIEGIEDANDCAYRQRISYDKFQNFKNNPMYKNVDKVKPKQFSNDYKTFITQEEAIKSGNFVEIWNYWNVEKDVFMQRANGVLVREHPIMSTIDGEKALPFTVRILGKKNYQIYGRGFCEALMMFNSEVNNLRELLMDGIRRSNTQVLAIGNGLSFDGRGFSYDNEILTFDGRLSADNFQQISGNPPNQAIFGYLDRLYKDISVYVGIDIQNVLGQPGQTAFQTEVQRESSQKRINVWLENRDQAYERYANLMKDAIQKHFPKADADGLFPMLESEDEELQASTDNKPAKFKKKKGRFLFEVTPDILQGDIYIDVYTNANATTIAAVDRDQKKAFATDVGLIAQNYAMAKQAGVDVDAILPLKDVIRDLAEGVGLTIQDKGDQEEVDKAKQKLMQDLQGMMRGAQAGQEMTGQEGAEAQAAAQGEIPSPSTPTGPGNPLPTNNAPGATNVTPPMNM